MGAHQPCCQVNITHVFTGEYLGELPLLLGWSREEMSVHVLKGLPGLACRAVSATFL